MTSFLGVDVSVSQLQLSARCELAALLDPADRMGRDWSILAVKLNLTDQLPEVDSTGQSLSRFVVKLRAINVFKRCTKLISLRFFLVHLDAENQTNSTMYNT
jgi:hypothetical protein